MFEVNEGVLDRIIRGIVGVALIIISILLLEGTLKIVIIVIGVYSSCYWFIRFLWFI